MSSVWVQLYLRNESSNVYEKGDPIPIEISEVTYGGVIAGLRGVVKKRLKPKLDHASEDEIFVYPPRTKVPIPNGVVYLEGDVNVNKYSSHAGLGTPLIVVAPSRQPSLDPSEGRANKKPKVIPTFNEATYDFTKVVNHGINNKTDEELLERDEIQKKVLDKICVSPGSEKMTAVTLWSARGSGKTSLLRRMVLTSDQLRPQRDCGRLMVFDCARMNEILTSLPTQPTMVGKVIPTLVAWHLCAVFGNTKVGDVEFVENPAFDELFNRSNKIPQSLQVALSRMGTSAKTAYEWWKKMTSLAFGQKCTSGKDEQVAPLIFLDTAEVLAKEHGRADPPLSPLSPRSQSEVKETPLLLSTAGGEKPGSPSDPPKHARLEVTKAKIHRASSQLEDKQTPLRHEKGERERYLVLESLMNRVPSPHVMVCFGTGAISSTRPPVDFLSWAFHEPLSPLKGLSFPASEHLFKNVLAMNNDQNLSNEQKRFLQVVYAVTAGVPRMLKRAFEGWSDDALFSSNQDRWESKVRSAYVVPVLTGVTIPSLAKAIVISSVFDEKVFDDATEESFVCKGDETTWEKLRERSVAFVSNGSDGTDVWRIPRLAWSRETLLHSQLRDEVWRTCRFQLDDLLPTVKSLYGTAKRADATASGIPWEKMFAATLVARFFGLCWKENMDPESDVVTLSDLLPGQAMEKDNDVLDKLYVCLGHGIKVFTGKAAIASRNRRNSIDEKAINVNWDVNGAHHDIILPVIAYHPDDDDDEEEDAYKVQYWAVQARNGTRKTEGLLLGDSQHLVSKDGDEEVHGLIQAVNLRSGDNSKRQFRSILQNFEEQGRYAEASVTEGHIPFVLDCFSGGSGTHTSD